jgi:hypothetical protein
MFSDESDGIQVFPFFVTEPARAYEIWNVEFCKSSFKAGLMTTKRLANGHPQEKSHH